MIITIAKYQYLLMGLALQKTSFLPKCNFFGPTTKFVCVKVSQHVQPLE